MKKLNLSNRLIMIFIAAVAIFTSGCQSENRPVSLTSLIISPNPVTFEVGSSKQLKIIANYSDGSKDNIKNATFKIDNTEIATIDKNAVLKALNSGETTLKVTVDGVDRIVDIKVPSNVANKGLAIEQEKVYSMPYYTGSIIPSPQSVTYKDKYLSLSNSAIILNGLSKDDPRVQYLLQRITQYGGSYKFITKMDNNYTCIIKLNDKKLIPPKKPQGYVIKSNGKTISLKGSDFQGLLWAISSLNQMIFTKDNDTLVRLVDVKDWPKSIRRGFLAGAKISSNPKALAHFMVAFKLNFVDFRGEIAGDKEHHDNWRLSRTDTFKNRLYEIKKNLTPLGFEWYAGGRFLGYGKIPQINCSSDEDFNIIYNNYALPIAKAGGNLSIQFDDIRFPLHKDDAAEFGTAANADYYLLTKLYDNLKKSYPNIRIAFTPPFYWGPTAPSRYPESRDDYLTMVGTLPKAIDVYWTGPRVRSNLVTQEELQWEADKIDRKPLVFQNGVGIPHPFSYHYVTDPIYNLKKWYYMGYQEDIKAYMLNGGDFDKSGVLVSIAEWSWNPESFEPEATIKDAVSKLAGSKSYPIFTKLNTELSKFDKYLPDITIDSIIHSETLYKAMENIENLILQLGKLDNSESIEFWTNIYSSHVSRAEKFVTQIRKASKDPVVQQVISRDDASVAMYYAVSDGVFDTNSSDIFIKPSDFIGGGVITYGYSDTKEGILLEDRPVSYITGKGTPTNTMSTTFELNNISKSSSYKLIISGADDFLDQKCPIKITLNGQTIFEGSNPFSNKQWNIKSAEISPDILKNSNTLTITNTSQKGNIDAPPFFMLNYVILHKN